MRRGSSPRASTAPAVRHAENWQGSKPMEMTQLREALRARMDELAPYLYPLGRRNGGEWCIGDETGSPGKSFQIRMTGPKAGVHKDFAGGESGGGPIDLWMRARGLDFKTACTEAAAWLGVSPIGNVANSCSRKRQKVEKVPPVDFRELFPEGVFSRFTEASGDLATNHWLSERIASGRGWKVQTILGLAWDCSLGWFEGKTAFRYPPDRAKLRWTEKNGKRGFMWLGGGPLSLWRVHKLMLTTTRRVFVCEGETDCISLIDAGAERDGKTAVVAQPSCDTFKSEWARLFIGKEVIVCLDNDDPGRRGTAKTVELIRPYARSVSVLDWREVKL